MELGPALTFYAKYPEEMDALYDDDADYGVLLPTIEGTDLDKIIMMVDKIGAQAEQEVRMFLGECLDRLVSHLASFCSIKIIRTRDNWEAKAWISKKGRKRTTQMELGISVLTVKSQLIARVWMWSRGGRSKEDKIRAILGNMMRGSKELGWLSGTLAYDDVPVTPGDTDALIENVVRPITTLDARKMERVLEIVAK